ncbi:hypothetical protein N3K66_005154 [Trichothecium roseum]|uniref:Uncharacterized protein n=1 Tax=Trichothecium roseum TaxID=47278 RepID=A0ACC0V3E1_9HYPO|nr:hypothetical protein N3K66_005154 [Trichothecium roseum]
MAPSLDGGDPFDDALNVEQSFYSKGYQDGMSDGRTAGTVEGRSFGLQTGFEKFLESGRLAGRAVVWANRLPSSSSSPYSTSTAAVPTSSLAAAEGRAAALKPLPGNARLEKNVAALYGLVDPGMLSTENSDESVQDFDDRVKRAQGKAKVIERAIGGK